MECEYAFHFTTFKNPPVRSSPAGRVDHVEVEPASDRYRGSGGVAFRSHRGVSSGRGRDLYPEQLVSENVPEDGEEKESDEGEDENPPGTLFMQGFLVAAQDEQTHADSHHGARQMSHETGLRPGRREGRREA